MKFQDKFLLSSRKNVGSLNQFRVLFVFIFLIFSGISVRLFWLQVVQGKFYRQLSEENRIRLIANPPIRGRLLDRKGRILADNKLSYSLSLQPRLVSKKELPILIENLANLLDFSSSKLNKNLLSNKTKNPFQIILKRDLSIENVLRFKEQEEHFFGAQINIDLIRYYPYKNLAAHALGYTQLINKDEYISLADQGYKLADRIGRTGIEAAFESDLRGIWGGEMLEVDAKGNVQRSLGFKPPEAGKDLLLTLDLDLQMAAENALLNKSAGAIIALDPRDGAIRAMASKPNFDLNFFSKSITTTKEYNQLFLAPGLPLLSRAVNAYDPGSTWKPVTAIAGMETGKFGPDIRLKTYPCIRYGSHCFPEHNKLGFGFIGYEEALRVSSNTFFYQVGVGVGSKALYDAALKLGFDNYTGIEISGDENKGLIGNKQWADKGRGWGNPGKTPWIVEDMASASIGQSVVQVTPLQLARAYAVFANDGYLITPHLVAGNHDWTSQNFRTKVDIQSETLETIRRGLRKVVISGTGMRIMNGSPDLPPVAGKSGTAEDSSGGEDHAWFVCFAPYDSSEIVVVAFAQNTPGGGSVHALPMARSILATWQELKTDGDL